MTLGAIVVAVILSAVFGGSDTTSSGGTAGSEDLAPNFSFTLYQGEDKLGAEKLDFAQLHGKPIVLNFWAGLCPPCRAEMPDLQSFYDESKDQYLAYYDALYAIGLLRGIHINDDPGGFICPGQKWSR